MLYLTAVADRGRPDLPRIRHDPARTLLNRTRRPRRPEDHSVRGDLNLRCPGCIRSGRSPCRSRCRSRSAGSMCRSLDVPGRPGRPGPRRPADVPLPPARPPRAGPDGLEAVRHRVARVQRRAVRPHVRPALRPARILPLNPDGKGSLGGPGLQGHRRRRARRRRHRRGLQHRLLVRHQHQPPALLGRAAPVVLQPARPAIVWLMFVTPAAGLGVMLADAPRPAGRQAPGRLLRRPDAQPRSSCFVPFCAGRRAAPGRPPACR